ncbi:MAG TPA: 3-hydroxyanthranilate 3,4-dioxygenase, partial [Bacteroidia bacterium]|nr:3-hydroxyanthranilate 3,4-dioxygenase [Bacteroidia bacterium]
VPHNPRRGPNTVGLVIERKRKATEKDGLLWFCEKCNAPLFQKYFALTNIMTQFQETFAEFYGNKELRTCKSCGHVMEPPLAPKAVSSPT